jgi:hypothetical protein
MEEIYKVQTVTYVNDWLEIFHGNCVALGWDNLHTKEEAFDLYEYFKSIQHQPERSKREDGINTLRCGICGEKHDIFLHRPHEYRCGALNSEETH